MSSIPDGLRVAVYNAMGGWGPYSVREIGDLFRTYGFNQSDARVGDVGGARRTAAEEYQECIDWEDLDQRRRYLMLVEDVLENYPPVEGVVPQEARAVHRALKLASVTLPSSSGEAVVADDLWRPKQAPRVFISHLAERRVEVHELARMLEAFGFACFVAHDAIEPSRSWQREIERALQSCDLLVAYITPGFRVSRWTDQEVGWALGRGVVAIPVAVEGENPYGFIGSYQAIKHNPAMQPADLSRLVFRAIVDAVFAGQRAGAQELVDRVAPLAVSALCKARSAETASLFFEVLQKMPRSSWTSELRDRLADALEHNSVLGDCVNDGQSIDSYLADLS